jgi:hypothetical protein
MRERKMIVAGNLWNTSITLPDDPPNIVVVRATRQAKALARSVYVYRLGSKWLVTSDSSEPPLDVAVWMVAANQNERKHET